MATVELTGQNFESVVGGADMVLVDFWASWCGPCRMFAPVFDRASEKHSDAVFGKVDTDAETELAQQFSISSIPTLMVIRDNIVLYAQPGALPEQALEELITKARELDMDEVRASIAQDQAGARARPRGTSMTTSTRRARGRGEPELTPPRERAPPYGGGLFRPLRIGGLRIFRAVRKAAPIFPSWLCDLHTRHALMIRRWHRPTVRSARDDLAMTTDVINGI